MKKITTVQGLDDKVRTLAEVAEGYFKSLTLDKQVGKNSGVKGIDHTNGKKINYAKLSLIGRIKTEIEKKNEFENLFVYILDEKNKYQRLQKIVLALPTEIPAIISHFNKFLSKKNIALYDFSAKKGITSLLRDSLENIFAYKSLVNNEWLGKNLNIKVCPYCNNQYTQTLEKQDKTHKVQFQLDHFYPKSLYPYLAVSFYNLIPSCNNCNLSKSNHDTFKENLIHPYEESFHRLAKFRTKETSDRDLIKDFLENGDFRTKNIDIELVSSDSRVQTHENIFHLEEIYKQHHDVISEIYAKFYLYPSSRIDELKTMFDEVKLSLFSEEELKRFILGNYTDEKDFLKRPLSKLTHDIAEELGLI